jgi:transposase InsO family protein
MASNKAFRMAQEQLNKKIAERFAERQASALMIASGPVAATLSYMYRATMDTELAETNARATAVFSVNAPGVPEEMWRVDVPKFSTWSRAWSRMEYAAREQGSKVTVS